MGSKLILSVESGELKVEIKGRDDHGQFTQSAELILKSGECAAISIVEGVSIQIFETQTTDN